MFEPKTDKPATFNLMRSLKIAKVVVDFSGGNDEGGVDGAIAYSAEGGEIDFGSSPPWVELEELVSRPVYDEYSTFAGDFFVDGRVIWDLESDTVKMEGDESISQSEGISKEF